MTTVEQTGMVGSRFALSRVAELTFDIVRRDFVAVYGLALAINVLPVFLNVFLAKTFVSTAQLQTGRGLPRFMGPGFIVLGLVTLLFTMLVYGALSWGAAERLQGRTPSMAERFTVTFRVMLVLIEVAILGYIAIVFASILLVVPGLMLATAWAAVVPVAVTEKTGVFASFRRSGELTKGHRWGVFLLLLVFWIGSLIVTLLTGVLSRAAFGVSSSLFAAQPLGPILYLTTFINLLVSSLVTCVGAVGVGVVYHELRALKGGFDVGRLTEVFS